MKVGDLVVPSSGWLSQAFYDAEQFGIGLILNIVDDGKMTMCFIAWSGFGVFNSWEYDFELEVVSESR